MTGEHGGACVAGGHAWPGGLCDRKNDNCRKVMFSQVSVCPQGCNVMWGTPYF